MNGKRLEYDAARLDLQAAQKDAVDRRMAVKVARAEHARVVAERAASGAASAPVADARRILRQAERDAKLAVAEIKVRRVRLTAARAAISSSSAPEQRPLARLRSAHDAVTARWMDYETDPAKLIAFPSMSDARDPGTAAFVHASAQAQSLRPTSEQKRVSTAEFAAYRDAVAELERTFNAAERTARVRAGLADPTAADVPAWQDATQQIISRSADALDRAAGAAASAFSAWTSRAGRGTRDATDEARPTPPPPPAPPRPRPATTEPPTSGSAEAADTDGSARPSARPIWPVPRRDGT